MSLLNMAAHRPWAGPQHGDNAAAACSAHAAGERRWRGCGITHRLQVQKVIPVSHRAAGTKGREVCGSLKLLRILSLRCPADPQDHPDFGQQQVI